MKKCTEKHCTQYEPVHVGHVHKYIDSLNDKVHHILILALDVFSIEFLNLMFTMIYFLEA